MRFTSGKRRICDGLSMAVVAVALLIFSVSALAQTLSYGRLLEPVSPVEESLETQQLETSVQAQGWVEVVNGERWVWTGKDWQLVD